MDEEELRKRLLSLPRGGISTKTIRSSGGKEYTYFFLQWREGNKVVSRRIHDEEVEAFEKLLEERRLLEEQLRNGQFRSGYRTLILTKDHLRTFCYPASTWGRRQSISALNDFLNSPTSSKVMILYGLRRTGKTTLMKQVISECDEERFSRCAFIQIRPGDTLVDLRSDLERLLEEGYKNIFIDEVTLLKDFIEGAAVLADIYASRGMKIFLSGTDSLGFWITKSNQLYDRCILVHTTFIPFFEFAYVLGIKDIDDYIEFGGTMSISGQNYNGGPFEDEDSASEYADSSIVSNIQHSLLYYRDGHRFAAIGSLLKEGELTNVIHRVIEDYNHRFALEVLLKEFRSSDLAISSANLRRDRDNPSTVLDSIDKDLFVNRLKERLQIIDAKEAKVELQEEMVEEIKEFLTHLEIVSDVDIVTLPSGRIEKHPIFTQPGLRYAMAKAFVETLTKDPLFSSLPFFERKRISTRVLSKIKWRMLEDCILLETKVARKKKNVFKCVFSNGEFDMVVADSISGEIELYEIKHSDIALKEQARHLLDKDKCDQIEFVYGRIKKKVVLYRGKATSLDGVIYQNIEEYLLGLYNQE